MEEDPNPTADAIGWRLSWYPRLLLLALGAALLFVVAVGDGSSTATGRVGGDYPAFYGAGAIVLDGDIDQLYDADRQSDAQRDLHGDETGYLAFAYPPHVAVAYAPLAALPYRVSYLVHTALMVGAVLAALQLTRPMVGTVDRMYWLVAAACLSLFPLFRAVGAGQNTALSLLLIAVVWRALAEDRESLAGLAAGFLLFRPQYAIPIIGLLLLSRHHRAVTVAAVTGSGTWLLNAAVLGTGWFGDWLNEVRPFIEVDAVVNAHNSVSWMGFGEAVLGERTGTVIGGALAVATAVALMVLWSRPDRFDVSSRVAVTAAGVLLISPHTMFYDAGLPVLTAVVAVDRGWLSWRGAGVVWALGLTHLAAGSLGATPLAIVVMAGFGAAYAKVVLAPETVASEAPVEVMA